jgi:hypothetical protein
MNDFLLEEEKEFKRFYKLSLWWVEHRALLKKIGIGTLIAFDAVLLLFIAWNVLDVLAINYGKEQREVEKVVVVNQSDLRAYTIANAAQALESDVVRVFSIGKDRYDFFTSVSNPNDDWWAEFTYKFVYTGGETEEKKGYILPNQEKPVVHLAFEFEEPVRVGTFEFVDVNWHRLDHKIIKNYDDWSKNRLEIEITNQKHTKENPFEKQVIGRTIFSAENKTAYSYYDPVFYILLKKGSSVVGVNQATFSTFESGSEEEVVVNWFGTLPSVSQVEIFLDLNLFDLETYKPLVGETSFDTRTRVFQ